VQVEPSTEQFEVPKLHSFIASHPKGVIFNSNVSFSGDRNGRVSFLPVQVVPFPEYPESHAHENCPGPRDVQVDPVAEQFAMPREQ